MDNNLAPGQEIGGYAALYRSYGVGATLCYGYGATKVAATAAARGQFAGAGRSFATITNRIYLQALTPEQASDVCEMLETPW